MWLIPILAAAGMVQAQVFSEAGMPSDQGYDCTIELIEEPKLSSSEGGVLTEILSEGSEVKESDVVAATDAEDALLMREAAWLQWQATLKDVSSDIKIRYADAQAKVNEAAYRLVEEANQRAAKAIAKAEIDRRKWEWQAGLLQVENSKHERAVQRITASKEEAEFKRAEAAVLRHRIKCPINGIVVERLKKIGEYVRPGDEVIRLARLDRLRAKGVLKVEQVLPHEAKGRTVTIHIRLGDDDQAIPGQISFVEPKVDPVDESYNVWVEFENLPNYAIRPGMTGRMDFNE
jgi:multidrug efflux pump subunit AcrA (membrane-fusion protein)